MINVRTGESIRPGTLSTQVDSPATNPISEAVRELDRGLESVNLSRLPPAARCELQFWLALLLRQTSDPVQQRRLVGEALDNLSGRPDLRAWGMIGMGTPCGSPAVPLSQHLRWLHRSLDVLPRLSNPGLRLLMLGQVTSVLVVVGDPAWQRLTDRLLSDDPEGHLDAAAIAAYETVGAAACYAGHHELARRLLTRATAGSPAADHPGDRAHARLALLDYCHGRWDGLRGRAEQLMSGLADATDARADAKVVTGCVWLAHGDLDRARPLLTETVDSIVRTGNVELLPIAASALIRLTVSTGEVDRAAVVARQLIKGVESRGVWAPAVRGLPWLAHAMLAAGRAAEAASLLHRVRGWVRGLDVPLKPAASAHARGVVTAHHGQWLPAAGQLLTAADRYERSGCRYEAAQAREQAADCLFTAGDPRAGRALRAAVATFQHLGAAWDADRAGRTAIRHSMPLPAYVRQVRRGEDEVLSPRQRQVAQLAAAGLTNEEIAHRLRLSHRTVDKHVGAALRKLGLHSRRSLVNYL